MDRRVLRLFGHIERMNERPCPKKVKYAIVEGHQAGGRQDQVWLD